MGSPQGPCLDALLRPKRFVTPGICGVITNNSAETTARTAGNLGHDTCVIPDATATFDKTDFVGQHRSAEAVRALSLANRPGARAAIVSTGEMLERPRNREPPRHPADGARRQGS
jgi:nicotinamidase-related amidase